MRVFQAITVASIFILTAITSLAGEPIKVPVGAPEMDASYIEPFEAHYTLEVFDAEGSHYPSGSWTDNISHVDIDGQRLLRRKVTLYNTKGELVFDRVHLADAKTLAPVRVEQIGFRPAEEIGFFIRYYHQEFTEQSVNQTIVLDNGGSVIQAPIPISESPFDYSIWATLLMSLPFVEGTQYQIPTLGQGGEVAWETITVEGLEDVELNNGKTVKAWKVSTQLRPWTVWLKKDQPYAVKFIQVLPNGKDQVSTLVSE